MDNLAREAMMAKQAGMSYGRWKAMHYNPTKAAPVNAEEKSEYEVKCLNCGRDIMLYNKRKRLYCDSYCGEQYRTRQRHEKRRKNGKT